MMHDDDVNCNYCSGITGLESLSRTSMNYSWFWGKNCIDGLSLTCHLCLEEKRTQWRVLWKHDMKAYVMSLIAWASSWHGRVWLLQFLGEIELWFVFLSIASPFHCMEWTDVDVGLSLVTSEVIIIIVCSSSSSCSRLNFGILVGIILNIPWLILFVGRDCIAS